MRVNLKRAHLLTLTAICLLILSTGCSERDLTGLDVARAKIDPLVFDEAYGEDVYFQAFSGTDIYAAGIDSIYAFGSSKSLKISVPPEGSALGAYAGGVLTSVAGRDHADFNALTFYARTNLENCTLDVAGFGNDNTGTSKYKASRSAVPLTPDWTFFIIPIPASSKLISERGQFTFAESWEDPLGQQIWFDNIQFAKLDNITDPFPVMPSANKQYFVGATAKVTGTYTRFSIDGAFVIVNHSPGYFDYTSTDPAVAKVVGDEIRVVGPGEATVTATLDETQALGSVTLQAFQAPTTAAPSPTLPAGDVISMFSDVYEDRRIDSWNPFWGGSTTQVDDFVVEGDNAKVYSTLNWVGIVFTSQKVDASEMTHLHLDVFAPAGTNFNVKVVAYGSADDDNSDHEPELQFNAESTPAFVAGEWSSLDIPLDDFQLAVPWDYIGMIVLSTSDARLVLVDNIYWHK